MLCVVGLLRNVVWMLLLISVWIGFSLVVNSVMIVVVWFVLNVSMVFFC